MCVAHKQKDKEPAKGHSKSEWQHLCGRVDKVQVLLLCSPQMLYRYPTLLDKMQSKVNDYCLELAHMTTLSHDAVKITDHVKVSSLVATRHPSLADARCRVQGLLESSQALLWSQRRDWLSQGKEEGLIATLWALLRPPGEWSWALNNTEGQAGEKNSFLKSL